MNGWRRCSIYDGIWAKKKKKSNNAFCNNTGGLKDYYGKWSKLERGRQIPYDITYVGSKIWHKLTYLQNRNKFKDTWLEVNKGKEWIGSLGLADASYYI